MTTNLDSPAADPVGTVRVHPDDDPAKPDARRYLLTDDTDRDARHPTPWDLITGNQRPETTSISELSKAHADVTGWPRQTLHSLAVALGHRATRSSSTGGPPTA